MNIAAEMQLKKPMKGAEKHYNPPQNEARERFSNNPKENFYENRY
jgi:hypothetical protein